MAARLHVRGNLDQRPVPRLRCATGSTSCCDLVLPLRILDRKIQLAEFDVLDVWLVRTHHGLIAEKASQNCSRSDGMAARTLHQRLVHQRTHHDCGCLWRHVQQACHTVNCIGSLGIKNGLGFRNGHVVEHVIDFLRKDVSRLVAVAGHQRQVLNERVASGFRNPLVGRCQEVQQVLRILTPRPNSQLERDEVRPCRIIRIRRFCMDRSLVLEEGYDDRLDVAVAVQTPRGQPVQRSPAIDVLQDRIGTFLQ
mmetsp:Transcript_68354/g.110146  ORF Transcript_68354/g.110146 Transcript_68354/m.110146 type:complete len:252 (-) Transcript_68354:521-1276(-)